MFKKNILLAVLILILSLLLSACNGGTNSRAIITYDIQSEVNDSSMNETIDILKARFKDFDCKVNKIEKSGEKQIKADISSNMEMKTVADNAGIKSDFKIVGPDEEVIVTGKDVKDSAVSEDKSSKNILILIKFNEEGKNSISAATSKNIGKSIKVYMDDVLITSPYIQAPITNGEIALAGVTNITEAKIISALVKSDKKLPYTLKASNVEEVK